MARRPKNPKNPVALGPVILASLVGGAASTVGSHVTRHAINRAGKKGNPMAKKKRKKNQTAIGPLIIASAVGGAASTMGAVAVERALAKQREAKKNPYRTAGGVVAPPAAEYAVKRWGPLSYYGPEDMDLTWEEFANRIAETGDPGALRTAVDIVNLPGRVSDYSIYLDNPSKLKNRLLK